MQAVCFDMDGVLVDSERHWVPLERERIFAGAVVEDVSPAEITGMNYRDVYDYLAERYEVRVDREAFLALYEDAAAEIYGERVTLLDGFPDLAAALQDAGRQVALVSSSPTPWIETVCARFDLDCFDAVVSADDVAGPSKPDPTIYRHAADRLGTAPADCVAVEDSNHGVVAANAVGMVSLGYRTDQNRETDLSAADAVVAGPTELRDYLC